MPLDERTQASFDAASEAIKQLLTLSVGAIGAAVALFDDGDAAGVTFGSEGAFIKVGLAFLAGSVICGLFSLGTLAGQLGSDKIAHPSTYAGPVRFFHTLQMATFGAGVLTLVYAAL